MSKIKLFLKNNVITKDLYMHLKNKYDKKLYNDHFKFKGHFVNRSKGFENLCIVLAGYKEFIYPAVFSRLEKYMKEDMDVCVVSSGRFSKKLDQLCKKNNWSYLSTEENHVALVQNVAIYKHPKARYIFKLDEDIFITEGYFDNMLQAYHHAETGNFVPGVMAPMLNINGFSYARIIEKLKLKRIYEQRFGLFKYATGPQNAIENNVELAKFMWGKDNIVPSIDELNKKFSKEPLSEIPCPFRFSIGAILFERRLWEDMGFFNVNRKTNGMGEDEVELDTFCCMSSRIIMVSENIVVGHLSFGPQNEEMKKYYLENADIFMLQKEYENEKSTGKRTFY